MSWISLTGPSRNSCWTAPERAFTRASTKPEVAQRRIGFGPSGVLKATTSSGNYWATSWHTRANGKSVRTKNPLLETCRSTVQRLSHNQPVPEIDAITPNSAERVFAVLAKSVRDSIEKNEPESGLDRLHTFVVKYMRVLCEKRGVTTERDKPLHSLVGEYIKRLKEAGDIESEMTERILKSSISILEAFNRVRNEQSFAHDNPILNYDESLLIFNHVASAIKFIESVERRNAALR